MIPKIFVTIGIIFYAVVVPILEVNDSHLFNPLWVPHARLHEAWQLTTNTAIGVFCLWLTWVKNEIRLSSLITFLITGGFLLAYVTRGIYGGSMVLTDGTEKILLGINLGVFGYSLAIILAIIAIVLNKRSANP